MSRTCYFCQRNCEKIGGTTQLFRVECIDGKCCSGHGGVLKGRVTSKRRACTRERSKDTYVEGTLAVTKCSSTHTCKETTWAWAVTAGDENRQGNLWNFYLTNDHSCSQPLQSVRSAVYTCTGKQCTAHSFPSSFVEGDVALSLTSLCWEVGG